MHFTTNNHSMKNLILTLIFALVANLAMAQPQVTLDWARGIGGLDNDYGYSCVLDAHGNIYTTGMFGNTVDFDPGPGVFNLTSAGNHSIYICKLDATGNFVWAKQMEGIYNPCGTGFGTGIAITVDIKGNVYTTGAFYNTVDFDPGPGVFTFDSSGVFISKLDAAGNFVWAKKMGNPLGGSENSIALDFQGNIYTIGSFRDTADFDPGIDVFNLDAGFSSDIFISKLDTAGNFVWAKQIGGVVGFSAGYSIALDAQGNSYITGLFQDTVDFDPGLDTLNLISSGDNDIFIAKLDVNGNLLWAKSIGGAGDDEGRNLTIDKEGNVYTIGWFKYAVDFNPGLSDFYLSAGLSLNIFISKLDAAGNFIWAKQMGGTSNDDLGYDIALDIQGNIYATGRFVGIADFDPGSNVFSLTGVGNCDMFVCKLDTLGNFIWANSIGGGNCIEGRAIVLDAQGKIYTVGGFSDIVDFDLGTGVFNLSSAGFSDIFITKWEECYVSSSSINHTACNSYYLNGQNYNTSGTYTQVLTNAVGCDSIITLNLTINGLNSSVTQNGASLTANATNAVYQWINCNGNTPISGATNQTFTPTTNGNYAVIVTGNNCSDTSACYAVTSLALAENSLQSQIQAFPNPTTGLLSIDLGAEYASVAVKVSSVIGQELMCEKYAHSQLLSLEMPEEEGIYFVEISLQNGEKASVKVVVSH